MFWPFSRNSLYYIDLSVLQILHLLRLFAPHRVSVVRFQHNIAQKTPTGFFSYFPSIKNLAKRLGQGFDSIRFLEWI
jgi:hypothetical protein